MKQTSALDRIEYLSQKGLSRQEVAFALNLSPETITEYVLEYKLDVDFKKVKRKARAYDNDDQMVDLVDMFSR